MKPNPTQEPPELVNANQIAQAIGRSTRSVIDRLRSLEIPAAGRSGASLLYRPEVIETVRSAMRAPNKTATTSTGA